MMAQYSSILVLVSTLVTLVAAINSDSDLLIAADSPLGQRLLLQATEVLVPQTRRLQFNEQRDISFIADYSIHYTGCSSQMQVAVNNVNGGNYNYNFNNKNGNPEMIYRAQLAHFRLCPTSATAGASSCGDATADCVGGGEYIMSLETFVDAYVEEKLSAQEYTCEMVRENCYCQDIDDDQACETQCYTNAGLTACIEVEGEGDAYEVQRYLECREVGFNRDNAAGAEQQANDDGSVSEYFIGPYCNLKDNFTVNLGLFADPYCSKSVDAELYMSELFYEADLPYTTVSIVDADTCIDCSNVDENQNSNNNNNNAPEVSETCEAMYSYAAKCERNMTIDEPDTSACDFIYGVVPPPNTVSPPPPPTNVSCQTDTQDSNTANQSLFEKCNPRAFSVVFGMAVTFGITTLVLLGAHAYLMYTATDNVPPPPSASQKKIPSSRSVEMEA